jgi:hypothetical protein
MLTTGDGLFLQIPGESRQRVLHPATVVNLADGTYSITLEEELSVNPGQDVLLFFETRHEFMQQAGRIDTVLSSEPSPIIGIRTVSKPVSAESRQCFRVSTVMSDLSADVGDVQNCPLVDVSATGFSIIAGDCFKVGQTVPATLAFEQEQFPGQACIQSVKDLGNGKFRFGLHAISDRVCGADLERGLHHISTAVQRQQLRRRRAG